MTPRVRVQTDNNRKGLVLSWVDPLSGRRRRRFLETTLRREAERAAAKLEAQLAAEGAVDGISWEAFRLRFADEHLANKRETTAANYFHSLNRFEKDIGSPRSIREINSSVLSRWAAALRASGLREASVATHLRCVRSALSWGHKMGMVPSVPQVVMPEASRSRGRPLSIWEVARLLRAVDAEPPQLRARMVDLVKGLWLSGLRLSEALALRCDRGPVRLRLDLTPPVIEFSAQKNKKVQSIPITPDFYRLCKRICTPTTGFVFPLGMVSSTVAKRISGYGVAAGIRVSPTKHASAHDLRRTFGQRWSLRVHPIVLKTIMRHSSIETTLRYYIQADIDEIAASVWSPVTGLVTKPRRQTGSPDAQTPKKRGDFEATATKKRR
jgi:integrase